MNGNVRFSLAIIIIDRIKFKLQLNRSLFFRFIERPKVWLFKFGSDSFSRFSKVLSNEAMESPFSLSEFSWSDFSGQFFLSHWDFSNRFSRCASSIFEQNQFRIRFILNGWPNLVTFLWPLRWYYIDFQWNNCCGDIKFWESE